ncbi:MAG: AAA family ATPase [Candidatus Acidiferrales bacterium]
MILDFYNLAEQPFGVTPDSRFLYLGPQHREALASLVYGTESNRGFLALIAKPGMGKTSLLYHYLGYLRDKARTAFVFRTDCDSREFIRHVLIDLGIDVSGMDLPAMHEALNRLLTDEMRAGRRFVLVVDEAQNLEEKVLESIRLLSNFETPWMKLMQIVLAGQPQLADRLASPSMAQLRQRVSIVMRIEPFSHKEVDAYIDHRLWIGGCDRPSLFTVGARKLIAEHSEGIPRNINNLCFNALSLGCALKRKTIDRDIVVEVISDLDLEPLRQKPTAKSVLQPPAPREPLVQRPQHPFSSARKQSMFAGWLFKVAIASALLLTLSWAVVPRNRRNAQPQEVSTVARVPDAAALAKSSPTDNHTTQGAPVSSPGTQPASALPPPASVQITPGETLYRISVKNLGKYDPEVLTKIRGLNPWLNDPNRIRSGRQILMPSSSAQAPDSGQSAAQSNSVLPTEAKQQ